MALETLSGIKQINGVEVTRTYANIEGRPIFIDDEQNVIAFKIQNGPVKEFGVNGCQVEDMVATAKQIIEGLNSMFPCRENAMMITKLDEAIMWSKKRTADRQARNVEGLSKA